MPQIIEYNELIKTEFSIRLQAHFAHCPTLIVRVDQSLNESGGMSIIVIDAW